MDLVSDYKKIIHENTECVKESLSNTFKKVPEEYESFYYDINKYYIALNAWSSKLEKDDSSVFFDNILFDLCSLIHCVVLGDKKLINFLYRNIIESFWRYCTNDSTSKDMEHIFRKVNFLSEGSKRIVTMKYNSQLKQNYDQNCHYIHVDIAMIEPDLKSLMDYYENDRDLSQLQKEFCMICNAMLCILYLLYPKAYNNMKDNAKGYLQELIPLKNRVELYNL